MTLPMSQNGALGSSWGSADKTANLQKHALLAFVLYKINLTYCALYLIFIEHFI